MQSTIRDARVRTFFSGLYDRQRDSVTRIKTAVKANLDKVTGFRCQYCGFPDTSTLDHYLEKAKLPELSIFARNLIPCCPYCNLHRGPAFTSSGERRLLHFYDDDVDAMPNVLVATVDFPAGGVPAATYAIIPSTHPLVAVYQRHFDALNLAARYESEARGQLLVIRQGVLRAMPLSSEQVASNLQGNAQDQENIYGRNDYLAALHRALATSVTALTWLMS
jgi:hypothetical protein